MNGNFQQLIASDKPVLVDFFAEWCGPCKMMAPYLKAVKEKMGEDLTIVKIDIDKNPALASQLKIQSVPTMVLYQRGQQLWRQSGVLSAQQIEQVVRQNTRN